MRSRAPLLGLACVLVALFVFIITRGRSDGDSVSRDLARQVGARRCALVGPLGSFVPAMYVCEMPTGHSRCYQYNGAKFVRTSCDVPLFPPEKKKHRANAGGRI